MSQILPRRFSRVQGFGFWDLRFLGFRGLFFWGGSRVGCGSALRSTGSDGLLMETALDEKVQQQPDRRCKPSE